MSSRSATAPAAPSGTGPEVAEPVPARRRRVGTMHLHVQRDGRLLPHVEGVAGERRHVAAAEDHGGERLGRRVLRGCWARCCPLGIAPPLPVGAVAAGAVQAEEVAARRDLGRAGRRVGEFPAT